MPRHAPTLLEVAVANLAAKRAGDREPRMRDVLAVSKKAVEAVAIPWALAVARHEMGYWPNQAEYAAYWKLAERQAGREWALVRDAFGPDADLYALARHVYAEMAERLNDRASVGAAGSVTVPTQLAAA